MKQKKNPRPPPSGGPSSLKVRKRWPSRWHSEMVEQGYDFGPGIKPGEPLKRGFIGGKKKRNRTKKKKSLKKRRSK